MTLANATNKNQGLASARARERDRDNIRSSERLGRCESRPCQKVGIKRICLDSGLESQEGIAGIRHLEDSPKAILGEITNLKDLQVWRHRAQVKFGNDNIIDDDRRFGGFIERSSEQFLGARVKTRVRHQRRPVEVERHARALE